MITSLFDTDSAKILSLFALSPGSRFRRQEIQSRARLNNVPLDKALSRLLSLKILKKENFFYSIEFNDFSKKIMSLLSDQYKGLKELPFDVYLMLIELSCEISAMKGIEAYLFGSYSKLIYTIASDIDIAIISENKDLNKEEITKFSDKLERIYGKAIELHFFEKASFYRNRKDPLVKDIIQNGTRIV